MRWRKIVTAAAIILAGCASVDKARSVRSVHIVWKTPELKYADMAFVRDFGDAVELELFGTANPLAKLRITPRRVCGGTFACMDAQAFNARYLSAAYPSDTLYRLLRFEPIFDAKTRRTTRHGFTQHIEKKHEYAIDYEVSKNRVHFRDTIRHIDIVIEGSGR